MIFISQWMHRCLRLLCVLWFASLSFAEQGPGTSNTKDSDDALWDRFRGPNGSGVSELARLPSRLSPADARWRTKILPGFSSPVLSSGCVFVTGGAKTELFTYCIDAATGAVQWQVAAPPRKAESKGPNSSASSTPATDGDNVYVFFEHYGLISYDADGNKRWDLELGPFTTPYGMGSSPIVAEGRLLMLCDQDVGSFLVAIDKETGVELWRAPRPRATHGFSTPVTWKRVDGTTEIIVSGSYEVVSYDLESGRPVWWIEGMAWQAKSVPVVAEDRLFIHSWMASPGELGVRPIELAWTDAIRQFDLDGNGRLSKGEVATEFGLAEIWFLYDLGQDGELDAEDWSFALARSNASNGLFAVRLGGQGNVTETHIEWQHEKSLPNVPSPLVYDGLVYVLKEGGILTALDERSGASIKVGRISGAADAYFASPLAANGRLLTASKDGRVAVIRAGRDWEVLSVSAFDSEIWATPAVGEGWIYVRTQQALYAFEARRK